MKTLVLQNRGFLHGSPQLRLLIWVGVLTVFLFVVAGTLLYLLARESCPAAGIESITQLLWEQVRADRGALFALIATPLIFGFFVLLVQGSRSRERLILSETGIEYRSPFRAPLNLLQRDWALQWCQVRTARVGSLTRYAGGQFAALILDAGDKRRRILLYPWVDPQDYKPRSLRDEKAHIRALRRQGPEYEEWIKRSPVITYITDHVSGVNIDSPKAASRAFALEKNSWTLGAIVMSSLLAVYVLIDGVVLLEESYAGRPVYEVFSMVGLLAAILVTRLLRNKGVPSMESAVVGVLTGASLGCALYPGLLRMNQLTDSSGLHTYTYRSQGEGRFVPLDETLPELSFDDHLVYWKQVGEHYEFELRRGGLGFYQLNLAPIHDAIADFYRTKGTRSGRQSLPYPS